jgi:aspartate aminotransferase
MLAERTTRVAASPTMQVLLEADRLRRQGVDVVDLGAGEPDFPTPAHVKAAGRAAIDADFTKYTATGGTPELRQAIAARYREEYGVDYADSEVVVCAGGKQALYNTAMALFAAGDEVITHAPGWPTISDQVKLADATPVHVRSYPEDGFALRAEPFLAAITPATRGIIINSPCNPTGALMSEGELARIADEAARRDIWLVLDLCYENLIYDPVPHNLPKVLTDRMRDRAVIAGSASKTYSMTGWRCGWALGPKPVIAACTAIQSHSTSNACSISQRATLAALQGSQDCVADMLAEYRRRRDVICDLLTASGRIRCVKPAGGFVLFPDVSDVLSPDGIRTSAELAQALLTDVRVALTAGEAFDAPGFVRISYATSLERLREGAARIERFIDALARGERIRPRSS